MMESKLPKPSGLRKPMPTRGILPTDRIKPPSTVSIGSNKLLSSTLFQPLTRDPTNIRKDRPISPDVLRKEIVQPRAKLRRSRSACDIRNMPPVKRFDNNLTQNLTTKNRFNLNSTSAPSTNNSTNSMTRVPRSGTGATSNSTAIKRPMPLRAGSGGPTAAKKPVLSSSTAVSNTGAGKTINKRIPPYDFKARYNDLLEKHKALKEKCEIKCEQLANLENMPEQLEETQTQLEQSQTQLYSVQNELKHIKCENDCLKRQIECQNSKINAISAELENSQAEWKELSLKHNQIVYEHQELSSEVLDLRELTAQLKEENNACKEQLFNSNMERKELHNTVMDLRGNIRVFCRVRPPLENENEKSLCGWNYLDEATMEIINYDLNGKNKPGSHIFNFDCVFHPGSSQDDIFEMVSPLIQSAMDGYNICIFAYGQTGSGKTYTMDGISCNAGVIPRTVDLLFNSVHNYKRLGWEYEIKVTFLEIYNEVLYDLLSNEQKDMEIRMVKNSKNDIFVSNITEEIVNTADRLRQLMHIAKMNRATAATVGNERSSRSHAVTKIELIGRHEEKNEISIGSINLVDLAGSESPKTSIRMNETKNINRSLSELTNVILALLQKQDHIPYRNSKLTHLLMPALGGNSKTLMFINVAPFQDCFVESVKSLRFAASVNSCKMAKAKKNRFLNTSTNDKI